MRNILIYIAFGLLTIFNCWIIYAPKPELIPHSKDLLISDSYIIRSVCIDKQEFLIFKVTGYNGSSSIRENKDTNGLIKSCEY